MTTATNPIVIAYTDGACKGNGKDGAAGGFGSHILFPNGDVLNIWGGEPNTTNNRMELMGAITALANTPSDLPLQLWTDSGYVQKGISEWIYGWKAKGWKKADGKPVLNQELWQQLDQLCQNRVIDWQWVKGHAGHMGNETADKLANLGVTGAGQERILGHHNNVQNADVGQSLQNHGLQDGDLQDSLMQYEQNTSLMDEMQTTDLAFADDGEFAYFDDADNADYVDDADDGKNADGVDFDGVAQNGDDEPETTTKPRKKRQKIDIIFGRTEQNPVYDGDTSRLNPDFWALLPEPVNRGKSERQLIMDTETTGFEDQNGDRIVEVGVIEMVGRKFTGNKLHIYINPDKQMDEEVIRVHGISNEFLTDKPTFAEVAKSIYEFMVDSEVIAHNAAFDMRFLKMEFDKVGLTDFLDRVKVTDTLAMAKQMYPGQKNSLDALVKRLDVGKKDRTFHGALLDSEILAEVFIAMTSGQISLAMGDDDTIGDTNEQGFHFSNLAQHASLLCSSNADFDADLAWRQSVLGQ